MTNSFNKSNQLYFFEGNDEERVLHPRNNNIELMIDDKEYEFMEELFP